MAALGFSVRYLHSNGIFKIITYTIQIHVHEYASMTTAALQRLICAIVFVADQVPYGSFSTREQEIKESICQLEVDVHSSFVTSHEPEGEWLKIAPLRILSFGNFM